jgi:hypothetical protein
MKIRLLSAIVFGLALTTAAYAQDAPTASPTGPATARPTGQRPGGGRGGMMGGMMAPGRGVNGTVTAVAADHYTVKTDAGEIYTIHFSANTRIIKQPAVRVPGGGGMGMGSGGGNPPQNLKPTEIKVGDAVAALGEVDAAAKSVGAVMVLQIDPERAKQMQEMQANYGKTWLMGKITAMDGVKVTLLGSADNIGRTFVADENTTFRRRRDPITLADVQVGDNVRVEGALKDGIFVATSVAVMGMPQGGTPMVPRNTPPPTQP